MLNNLSQKKAVRLSRFSQNISPEILKNVHQFMSRQGLDDRDKKSTNSHSDSPNATKRSIMLDERRTSKDFKVIDEGSKQVKQEDLFSKENAAKKEKYYDIDELKKFRQSMMELPNLQDKNKKTKFKHITPEFIEFFFQIMKSLEIIQKLFASYIPHEAVVNQFLNILAGFVIKKEEAEKSLEFSKDDDDFYIFVDGAAEKLAVKQAPKLERKSTISEFSSQTSIIRRSKMKNKTVIEKGKIICLQGNMPVLINEKDFTTCSIKTIGVCTFVLIDKGVWTKFLMALQKLEQKHLVWFIKHCTTINLNIYTDKEKTKCDEKIERKKFLHDQRFPNDKDSDASSDDNPNSTYKSQNERKGTIHGNSLSSSYKLFPLLKDQKLQINNQDVYLIVKGSIYLDAEFYSMIISEGSIINSSILLDLDYKEVNVKALSDSLIVKLILGEVYFQKSDQIEFIEKIKEIQEVRSRFNNKKISSNQHDPVSNRTNDFKKKNLRKTLNDGDNKQNRNDEGRMTQTCQIQQFKENSSFFEPKQLRIKELSFIKGNQKQKPSQKKVRISHSKNLHTEPSQSYENEMARKVAIKYANNYCIFEKIVQSQEKVIESYNLNRVNKLFPIQALLKNIDFTKFLEGARSNSRKHTFKKVNFLKAQQNETNQKDQDPNTNYIERMHSNFMKSSRLSKKSSKSKENKKIDLQSLRKRRQKYGRTLMEKKKKQKAKIIDNLFQINPIENKNDKKKGLNEKNKLNKVSLDFHKQRIKQIVNRNSQMRLQDLNSERIYVDFRGSNQDNVNNEKPTKSKYSRQFILTQPNYSEMKTLQKVISGQKLSITPYCLNNYNASQTHVKEFNNLSQVNDSISGDHFLLSDAFLELKKRTTRRIQTTMLSGRIRSSRGK